MNTALLLTLLLDGDGENPASGPQGFLCVSGVSINPGLICRASSSPGMEGDAIINPGLIGQPKVNQCQ